MATAYYRGYSELQTAHSASSGDQEGTLEEVLGFLRLDSKPTDDNQQMRLPNRSHYGSDRQTKKLRTVAA